ncbi:portal protein [Pseudomonas alliivorans]|uniref:Portal protein n=1 Tax=Pseudomonas prosekii TaxID=1148509 RepID=A0A2U2D5E9_9PSED|nr:MULTISPECIES: portal protein [Pseudomonas]MCM2378025.1 portal protein [Pseudomonas marginalis]MEE5127951.1 portal protein [Pseudomonas alliivorans]PWE42723.1 portal protein [Pseudomonas prosekii]
MRHIPPQLMGAIPQSAGGFGAVCNATQVLAIDELAPEQARLLQINELLVQKVTRVNPKEVYASNGN